MSKSQKKRSLTIAGHRTSISLETPFWDALKDIASHEGQSVSEIVRDIDQQRGALGLSAAVRIRVLEYYKARSDARAAVSER